VLIAADTEASQTGASNESLVKDKRIHFLQSVFLSDISSWLIVRAAQIAPRQFLRALVGGAYAGQVYADPEQRQLFREMVSSMALLSRRRAGARNDNEQYLASGEIAYENISTPVLILHGSEDAAVSISEQERLHAQLPNSNYLEIDSGTHFMPISHTRILINLMLDFLDAHAPD
jgi:pimeloyl-ACP methyl ester carboxylesterase